MGYYSNNTDDWTEQTQETALIGHFSFCMCHHRNFLLVFFAPQQQSSGQRTLQVLLVSVCFSCFHVFFFIFFKCCFNQKAFFIVLIFFFSLNHWCLKFAQRKRYLTNKCDVIIIYDLVCMHSVCVCVCTQAQIMHMQVHHVQIWSLTGDSVFFSARGHLKSSYRCFKNEIKAGFTQKEISFIHAVHLVYIYIYQLQPSVLA